MKSKCYSVIKLHILTVGTTWYQQTLALQFWFNFSSSFRSLLGNLVNTFVCFARNFFNFFYLLFTQTELRLIKIQTRWYLYWNLSVAILSLFCFFLFLLLLLEPKFVHFSVLQFMLMLISHHACVYMFSIMNPHFPWIFISNATLFPCSTCSTSSFQWTI